MRVPGMKSLVLAAFLLAVTGDMAAQPATSPAALSPASNNVLKTLGSLETFPDVKWRFHAGDMPHAEAADLNDSSWKVVKGGYKTGEKQAVWFRSTIVVPPTNHGYDITGSQVWFRFRVSASGTPPQIIYFNGRRVAMGEDLEPILLFDHAKPGDKVVVAVKVLQTEAEKNFRSAELRVDVPESRPNPLSFRQEALAVSEILPALPGYSPAQMDKVNAIITSVKTDALAKGDQKAFDASLVQARAQLKQFQPALKSITVDMVGNSHIDAAWLWPATETVDVVKRTFGTALQLMHEYPEYKYTQSAAQYNAWMAAKYPEMNREIKRRIAEGRWEIVGGMWVEPDLNMPDGEGLVRQLLTGKRYFQKEYGVNVRIGWNPDSFGYNWQLPQIYKKSGVDYFVTQKMTWSDTNKLPLRLFWWESPDGSKVLTYFPTGYGHQDLSPAREGKDFAQAAERNPGTTEAMDLYGIGDHGGGPTRTILDEGVQWTKPDTIAPTMHFSTAQSFFSDVEKKITPNSPTWNYDSIAKGWHAPDLAANGMLNIPTWKDELYLEYHRGVFTTQAKHKEYMRRSEVALLDSEKFASLAWLDGKMYPTADFERSWQKVSFGQFHDLAAGSGIGVIYKEQAEDYEAVLNQAHMADDVSLPTLAARINTAGDGVPFILFNPLSWKRSDVVAVDVQMDKAVQGIHVVDAQGNTVPSQVVGSDAGTNTFHLLVDASGVPSLGYAVYHAVAGAANAPTDLKAQGLTLENAQVKVMVDPKTGCVTSLVEKKSGFETIASGGCGNQLQTFTDKPKDYDAWNIDPGTLDHFTPIDAATSVKLTENGPLRAAIEIERSWGKSHFLQRVVLEAGSNHVNFENKVDWREEHVLLKAAFPLAATGPKATYEIPYGTIDRSTLRENTWEKAMFEVPALRWADLGDGQHGVSLLNDSKYGYDAVGNWLRLSLLRSPKSPDPDADMGMQVFRYAVYPHAGDWKQALSMRAGWEFNYPLRALQVSAHAGTGAASASYVSIDQDNVVLTAVKKAEDRNALVFRFFEWAGKGGDVTLHVPAGALSATNSDMMENPSGSLKLSGDTVTVPVKPYEIVTLQVNYKR